MPVQPVYSCLLKVAGGQGLCSCVWDGCLLCQVMVCHDAHSTHPASPAGGISNALPAGACRMESGAHWQAQHIVQAPQG